jgi:hypothetical protein
MFPRATKPASSPGVFDQDATHRLGRRTEEMRAILKGWGISTDQPHPGLVDERGGLERMAGSFVGHLLRRQTAELFVNDWRSSAAAFGSPCSTRSKICVNSLKPSG